MNHPPIRLFVNGFTANCTSSLVEQIGEWPDIEHIFWLRDAVGSDSLPANENITVLDTVETLHVDEGMDDGLKLAKQLPPPLRECFFNIRPATLIMMNRLERYGPRVKRKKREEIFANNFFYCLELIEQEGINGFVSSGVPHEVTDFIFREICRTKKIKCLIFYQVQTDLITTVPHYSSLGSDEMQIRGSLSVLEEAKRAATLKKIRQQYRPENDDGSVTHFYMKAESREKVAEQRRQDHRQRIRGKMGSVLTKIFSKSSWNYAYYLLYKKRVIQKKLTETLWDNYHEKCAVPDLEKDKYVLLFLHYQPEMTSSPLAEDFVDQYKIARLLMDALPPGLKLYVKEHPAQTIIGRSLDYYDKFPQEDRLLFIDEKYSSGKLQRHAVAIATCTGTAGFEAIWKNTPVLVFGNAYYQNAPNVFRIRRVEGARRVLEAIIKNRPSVSDTEVDSYLEELIDSCRVGNLSDPYFWNSDLGFGEEENSKVILSEIRAWVNLNWPRPVR